MRAFADLFRALDETTSTNLKIEVLASYFESVSAEDAAWTLFFLSGRKLKRIVPMPSLRRWAAERAGVDKWLFLESYTTVGDLAETITLLLPETGKGSDASLAHWVEQRTIPLREMSEDGQQEQVQAIWSELSRSELFVWHKLITGGFRVGVSRKLIVRGLEKATGIDEATLMHRITGHWDPNAAFFRALCDPATGDAEISRPYPFCLAYQWEGAPEGMGEVTDWQIEWKWDGIRAQVIRRGGETFIWSRGEELVTESYPEVAGEALNLPPGTVLDGELVAWNEGVLSFGALQRRLGRKAITRRLLDEIPVVFMAFDLIEAGGIDIREAPTDERRALMRQILTETNSEAFRESPLVSAGSWEEAEAIRKESRERGVEGFMLKRRSAPYGAGRKKDLWWKWKVDPFSVDAVMIYAQRGHGRRAGLYTDYTFAVWDGDTLVPFAKAYSGLTDKEIREVDRFVRNHTTERFGPVRSVEPRLVFELGFEGIWQSPRHKSGIAVRFPRILRLRRDKAPEEAARLDDLQAMLPDEEV
jgi:DNA ligase 1